MRRRELSVNGKRKRDENRVNNRIIIRKVSWWMKQKYVKPDIRFVPLHDQPDLMEEWLRHHVEEGEELAQERDGVEQRKAHVESLEKK